MVPTSGPAGWEGAISAFREAKNAYLESSPESPLPEAARKEFRGLDYYPPDASLRLAGSIEWVESPTRFRMLTSTGEERPAEKIGRVTFDRGGQRLALSVYRFLDEGSKPGGEGMFLPFLDATSGKATYPGGRFVELEGPDEGPFVLDFNRAYHPYCAYGSPDRWQCPVPPAENRLPVAIEAGERGWTHAH